MATFTIISSVEQKKYVIETEATTMSELTAAMDAAGINYSGMTLYEGLTKAEYNPEKGDAILPHDVPYKGTTTNDLVFMLTAPQKKIKSGSMTYTEMKSFIKERNLIEEFENTYCKSFTQGSAQEFADFISVNGGDSTESADEKCERIIKAIKVLVDNLKDYEYLCGEDAQEIFDILATKVSVKMETVGGDSPYSDNDVDNMFADM